MRPTVTRFVTDVIIILVTAVLLFYLSKVLTGYTDYFRYAYAGLILSGGVLVSRALSRVIAVELKGELGKNAPVLSNAVGVLGYVVAGAAAAAYLSFSPGALLAEAAFSGLVLGLALQPTLGSFFAGILILLSGAIRPGSHVRILTWHIPFQWANMPGYKYFSPDSVYAGYMGEVKEVGLFFTKILTEEGQMMKIPNSILATDAAVLSYTEEDYFFNVRYEFPNTFDPEMVLFRIREDIREFPIVNLFVNEQSDKEYYIVKAVLNAKEKDHALLKSEILTRLVRLHRELQEEQDEREQAKPAEQPSPTVKPS
jgi:small-conductance mechanosensitive channel